ncbi:pilus assembly protein TadG-related protein [Nocardioides massiliensis]|uniref:Flp pilus assembly protein TadG n=1 Tax=Nocardioides massiliensis TaxID=1325935 RepID=A0ABT9NIW8_9ACTN|nr:pilus assembly protein TadG-related protein [Nocardioides massiliensis]MDP9820358.1 Flp pilus assembly protein TadG [Nocardioides massiliensis]
MSRRDDAGSVAVLVIGFFIVALTLVAVVVDASAAYLERQRLTALADSAAIAAADGVQGEQVYERGLPRPGRDSRVDIDPHAARSYVAAHLTATDAWREHPGLSWTVRSDGDAVVVELRAPFELPLGVPGVGDGTVTGRSSAVVVLD